MKALRILKGLILSILLTYAFASFAIKVTVEVDPPNPVAGESFFLIFKIQDAKENDPEISFNSGGADVINRSNQGLSIRAYSINGRMTTTREITYAYELATSNPRTINITNIKVSSNGEEATHPSISVNVARYPQRSADIFAMAIPDKTEAYVGEGIMVHYYLYRKVNMVGEDIDTFPKLDKFLKRYLDLPPEDERVNYNGEIHVRSRRYSAKIFPNKPGTATIDPIKFKVQYSENGDVFNAFGLGLNARNIKTKVIASPPVKITVKPLPAANVPPSFTGLVGRHDFSFKLSKEKFLTNEAVEGRLEVSGGGALELFESPAIFTDPALEEFETKADLQIRKDGNATKVLDYTYLARAAADFKARELVFSYFDPEKGTYEEVKVPIPGLSISGTSSLSAQATPTSSSTDANKVEQPRVEAPAVASETKILAPIFKYHAYSNEYLKMINIGLTLICLGLITWLLREHFTLGRHKEKIHQLTHEIRQKGINYGQFFSLVELLARVQNEEEVSEEGHFKLGKVLEKSELSAEAKKYFLDILSNIELSTFKSDGSFPFKFEARFFDELAQVILKKKRQLGRSQHESSQFAPRA